MVNEMDITIYTSLVISEYGDLLFFFLKTSKILLEKNEISSPHNAEIFATLLISMRVLDSSLVFETHNCLQRITNNAVVGLVKI